jgi:hypothetical protein
VPTAAQPGGRRWPPPGKSTRPRGRAAAGRAPTAAWLSVHLWPLPSKSTPPRGRVAAGHAPTAAQPAGRPLPLRCKFLRPRGRAAAGRATTAARPAGRCEPLPGRRCCPSACASAQVLTARRTRAHARTGAPGAGPQPLRRSRGRHRTTAVAVPTSASPSRRGRRHALWRACAVLPPARATPPAAPTAGWRRTRTHEMRQSRSLDCHRPLLEALPPVAPPPRPVPGSGGAPSGSCPRAAGRSTPGPGGRAAGPLQQPRHALPLGHALGAAWRARAPACTWERRRMSVGGSRWRRARRMQRRGAPRSNDCKAAWPAHAAHMRLGRPHRVYTPVGRASRGRICPTTRVFARAQAWVCGSWGRLQLCTLRDVACQI